jgi:hypothetical protein
MFSPWHSAAMTTGTICSPPMSNATLLRLARTWPGLPRPSACRASTRAPTGRSGGSPARAAGNGRENSTDQRFAGDKMLELSVTCPMTEVGPGGVGSAVPALTIIADIGGPRVAKAIDYTPAGGFHNHEHRSNAGELRR